MEARMEERLNERLEEVRTLLAGAGMEGEVSVAGAGGEIVAVRGDPALREGLARLAPEIRSLGFRYVALEPGEANHDNEDS